MSKILVAKQQTFTVYKLKGGRRPGVFKQVMSKMFTKYIDRGRGEKEEEGRGEKGSPN